MYSIAKIDIRKQFQFLREMRRRFEAGVDERSFAVTRFASEQKTPAHNARAIFITKYSLHKR